MTNNFTDAVSPIAALETTFQSSIGEAAIHRDDANSCKVEAYAALINALTANRIKKGSKRAGEFRAALEAAGVSKACAKRYMEIGQAAAKLPMVKAVPVDPTATDDDRCVDLLRVFAANNIKTEAALKAVCFPTVEKSLVEKLVEAAKAGTDSDDEALQALLDAAAAVNPAAQDVASTLVAHLNRGTDSPLAAVRVAAR